MLPSAAGKSGVLSGFPWGLLRWDSTRYNTGKFDLKVICLIGFSCSRSAACLTLKRRGLCENRSRSLGGVTERFSTCLEYRYVERSIKYGVLFLVLVFTAFFLFEVTAQQKIHPFQYLMVGAALCLFYLLLLSVSEFIGFSWAYLMAALASTALITWYCRFFLGGGVRTFLIGAGLGGIYLFLCITLRQQDYALLMGAIALFVVLAIVMYVTRKVDWYARDAG